MPNADRRSAADTSAPAASASETLAATGTMAASLNVDTVKRLDRVRTVTGNAARLAKVLVGGGSRAGTPRSPRAATKFVCPR